ncbi:2Fe-2S iron-sulfur cluster binding domain-containing protein [Mesorhizobium sp. B3-1-3]|uniref:2Fe-2S iron-sulfur cluster-binding protein n=1 Tax=unclassified Mesorhizobium TaxID=325217 RepID=UPI00112BEA7E|nr:MULTISPECIES: 2Fe-2S iron-sulfur cluster-binding protein [unclassified Mesorhizobium]TPI56058.1 2Fe-2S iron-sulfur cluster binding domain-containing protein [Mesorhizobium sp. B3-1-8]TPI63352.1 2Fe-2S iron-sulfur cluster binding domain-containing protein [Mesorhizobium sp. B3-1-3]
MTTLKFVLPDGSSRQVEAEDGHSIMETAINNDVPGIVAECAGSMACATCHIFVDAALSEGIGAPVGTESDMLDFAAVERQPNSRLSCQVIVAGWMDGTTITVPETQV